MEAEKPTKHPPAPSSGASLWALQANSKGEVYGSWPRHLPRPPSMKQMAAEDEMDDPSIPTYAVFNANTDEGAAMVRVLSERGIRVVAVFRVFVGKRAQELVQLKRVVVKAVDHDDVEALQQAAEGCQKAFLVTRYWQRFENKSEERIATTILQAAALAGVPSFTMVTFDDSLEVEQQNNLSQLVPNTTGEKLPIFGGMYGVHIKAQQLGIKLSHMYTSYHDLDGVKTSVTVIRNPKGLVVAPLCFNDASQLI